MSRVLNRGLCFVFGLCCQGKARVLLFMSSFVSSFRIKLLFSGHVANKFRRPTVIQLNIEGLTASKINVLHYLAMQSTDAEKLVLSVGMQSVNPSIKPSCSLLGETTQVWLLQLCLPSLTESGGIYGPGLFGALTSHTLVEMHGVF